MSVLERLSQSVADEERQRGQDFLSAGAVNVQYVTDGSLSALVRASTASYRATLEWEDPASPLDFSCTCGPFRTSGSICAHIVAAALAAEQQGKFPSSRATMPRNGVDRPMRWLSSTGELRRAGIETPRPKVESRPSAPSWKKQLMRLKENAGTPSLTVPWPADRQVLYIVDVSASLDARSLVIRLACRDRRQNGQWSRPKTRGISFPEPANFPDSIDRKIVSLLRGGGGAHELIVSYDPAYRVPESLRGLILPMICQTERALLLPDPDSDELLPLVWEELPWEFWLDARRDETNAQYEFTGWLRRGDGRIPMSRPSMITGGVVFLHNTAAPLDDQGAFQWVSLLRTHRTLNVPLAQANEFLNDLISVPQLPRLDLPPELQFDRTVGSPRPRLRVRRPGSEEVRPERLRAELSFDYDGVTVRADETGTPHFFQSNRRLLVARDHAAEASAAEHLRQLGLREANDHAQQGQEFWFNQRHLPRIVDALAQAGWHVEADGSAYRRPGKLRLSVTSGIDWFELRGEVDYDGRSAALPRLLAALKKGESTVRLDDGTFGIIPEKWLKQYAVLAATGEEEEDFLKFTKTQAGLLDALLSAQGEVTCDEIFEKTRQALRTFDGIEPINAPPAFVGHLRPYQQEGLGWFDFLRRFGFGGCLADDMGLGKTIQVLALLEARKGSGFGVQASAAEASPNPEPKTPNPSLVVVPKSLVFNWRQEASRFTPGLRILDHTGIDRARQSDHLLDYDVIVTTYGTLRRDVPFLKDVEFDYVILDEAQAIKNPDSESAKAVRLIKGRHRLALSGTPVQNHLGDLWSLFEFLNPGLLGGASVFDDTASSLRNPEPEARALLSRALRPFILRRTKDQVAADLPPRLEQTIYCELEPPQRKLYDELREHYRQSLLSHVERNGLNRSKMQILEALLRLRQAALHPGLLDPSRSPESSAKLDVLLPQLDEVIDEGHKALVFSQFTSMLAIVRDRLDQRGIAYEYLDGKTRDREERVQRFQSDENCKLFLISLKAGGLGLNLTAADYVFLLDPWWNPAVEAQAIDRAHRIGQTRQVFACRLIAKDTVEEKVLALQQTKRSLADAIIGQDNSVIRDLGREELELLLS